MIMQLTLHYFLILAYSGSDVLRENSAMDLASSAKIWFVSKL